MITDINDYFTKGCDRCARFATPDCAVQHWASGLAALRTLCLDLGLTECVKWGHPCYMHANRNIAVLGAFRDNFRLSFMNAALLRDTARLLEPIGPNSQTPSVFTFTSTAAVTARAPIITAYLRELMDYATAGIKPAPKHARPLILPEELATALASDPPLATAFHALTPGRQRSWCLHISSAKQFRTRARRITAARDTILRGKGHNER